MVLLRAVLLCFPDRPYYTPLSIYVYTLPLAAGHGGSAQGQAGRTLEEAQCAS
jgi:hypothetical protein